MVYIRLNWPSQMNLEMIVMLDLVDGPVTPVIMIDIMQEYLCSVHAIIVDTTGIILAGSWYIC